MVNLWQLESVSMKSAAFMASWLDNFVINILILFLSNIDLPMTKILFYVNPSAVLAALLPYPPLKEGLVTSPNPN